MTDRPAKPDLEDTLPSFDSLRERERLYRRLVELSPEMICVQSQNRIAFINAAGARLLGTRAELLIGRNILDFIDPQDHQRVRETIEHMMKLGREVPLLEQRLIRADGSSVDVELVAGPLTYRGNAAVQFAAREITERKRADASLKRSEERYRELFENANDIVYTHDLTGRFTSLNKAGEIASGYTRDEVLTMNITDLLPPELGSVAKEMMRRKIKGEETTTFYELELLAKSGRRVPLEVSTRLIYENGVAIGVQGIARDITERTVAESDLKQTVSLLRSTLESTYDGILVVDLDGNILSFNKRFTEMWGIPPTELNRKIDDKAVEFVSNITVDPAGFVKRVAEINANPGGDSFDLLELTDARAFERYSMPQLLDGQPVGRVWSFRDVTDRKKAERALLNSEERYRLLFERNLAGVYRNTLDGRIIDCNDACARIFGYSSREEILKYGAFDIYFDPSARQSVIKRLLVERTVTNLEVKFRRKDGVPVWILENVTLLDDEQGNPAFLEGTLIDITDRKRAEERIEHQAYHDELTGLPNRALFKDRLTVALSQARRTKTHVAVMFLDLDQFKFVNDTMGHSAGDQLLWGVAERLDGAIRQEDTVARLGGDEFTLLLTGLTNAQDAEIIAQKLLKIIAEPFILEGHDFYVTTSIGIALFPNDGEDAETLLKNSDNAMYRAKEDGRNTYHLCTPEMNRRAVERLGLQKSLRRAFDREEFLVYYQPIVNLRTSELVAMEALVRWEHPEKGLIDAGEFIGTAEETRLLISIGEWVLLTACAQARSWEQQGLPPLTIAVNLSARQFEQKDLARTVERVLARHSVDPRRVALEINETTAMNNVDLTTETLGELKRMGLFLWLDNLGTGRSSLSSLKRFPLDRVKIDRTFVKVLPGDPGDRAIVSAVLAMAHALELKVIAEGVETPEQMEFLNSQSCDEAQGHLISRPLPPEEIEELLRGRKAGVSASGNL